MAPNEFGRCVSLSLSLSPSLCVSLCFWPNTVAKLLASAHTCWAAVLAMAKSDNDNFTYALQAVPIVCVFVSSTLSASWQHFSEEAVCEQQRGVGVGGAGAGAGWWWHKMEQMAYARHKLRQMQTERANSIRKQKQHTTFVGSTRGHPSTPSLLPLRPSPCSPACPCHLPYNSCQTSWLCHNTRVATPVGQGVCASSYPLLLPLPYPFRSAAAASPADPFCWSVSGFVIIMFVCPFVAFDWRISGLHLAVHKSAALSTIRCAMPMRPPLCTCYVWSINTTYISAAARFLSRFNGILTAQ